MTIATAISTLKLHQVSRGEVDEALAVVLDEVQRYRAALKWYATESNWLDGAAGHHDANGEWQDDGGLQARIALRLVDAVGAPLTPAEQQAVHSLTGR